ncbi:MAG: hypothetical protein QM733_02415 [Ilumatobacteraceae bacterium]
MAKRVPTPEFRRAREVFDEPLPDGPLVVHFTAEQWAAISEPMAVSKRRIAADAKGMFVLPDPFGGFSGWFACAAGSGEGVACIPELVRVGGTITFGPGCSCLRGKDPVERPIAEEDTCSLGFTRTGRLTCLGKCAAGRTCRLVRTPQPGGGSFVTCACG